MARSRNIKPGFFTDDELGELEPLARLLFIGMWTIADFKGDFEWRPKKLKVELLPWDDTDIVQLAINLDKSGFIRFYSDQKKIYCRVVNFAKHQNPHKNEKVKGSEIPVYSESMRQVVDLQTLTINLDQNGTTHDQNGTDPADSLNLIPDSLNADVPESRLIATTAATADQAIRDFQQTSDLPPPGAYGGNQKIPTDFRPNAEEIKLIKMRNVPDDFVEFQLQKFRIYWRDRGECRHSWGALFVDHCVIQWQRNGHNWDQQKNNVQTLDDKKAILAKAREAS